MEKVEFVRKSKSESKVVIGKVQRIRRVSDKGNIE